MHRTLVVFTILLLAVSLRGEDWPQFRGPNCSGVSVSATGLPVEFSESAGVAWSVPLGDGIGSPVVVDGRVFTSAMIGSDHVGLYAFDASTGEPLWMRQWPLDDPDEIHLTNSHASTTPCADQERVYFYSATLGMRAVDAATGADVWHRDLPVPFIAFGWGPGMSPVLYKDMLLFCQDDDLNPALYAFDKRTGEIHWKDDRHDMAVNYSHPVICETEQGDEIVVGGTGRLVGYAPETGERLWYARVLLRNQKTTPVSRDGVVYVSLQSIGIAYQWLQAVDQVETGNGDGRVSRDEIERFLGDRPIPEEFFRRAFGRGDTNGDGFLEGKELDLAFLSADNFAGASFDREDPADESIVAVRGGGRGDVTDTHVLWRHRTKHTDHIVSPLVTDNRMLLIKKGGIATSFETAGGEPVFGPMRIRNGGNYYASPVTGDGRIYACGENGKVVVLSNTSSPEVLAVNDLGDSILGTPAIADGALFFRTRTSLKCVR